MLSVEVQQPGLHWLPVLLHHRLPHLDYKRADEQPVPPLRLPRIISFLRLTLE